MTTAPVPAQPTAANLPTGTPTASPTAPGTPLALDQQLCFAIYSASHAFTRVYKPLLDALDLTYPQYLVMLVLWQRDGQTVKAIGAHLHLDSGTLTPLLKRLEAAGLIRRDRDPDDERQVRITLTAEGWALKAKADTVPGSIFCALGGDAAELRGLHEAVNRVRDRLIAAAR